MIAVPCVSSAQTIDAAVAAQLLKPDPNVGLDVLDQMAEMDMAVGVRQGGGDEDAACGHAYSGRFGGGKAEL